ncbi:MAG TPA: hypothetical protein VH597_07340 [Verrucomicrobiae bacterium]|jgi:hypothetical protein|nr:hypothetical protein [Verrucomicrobiae bacterium]
MFLRLVKLWIWISALASAAGWILSALGMLNKTGYLLFAVVVLTIVVFSFRKSLLFPSLSPIQSWGKLRRRFLPTRRRRFQGFLPASFAILAGLVFLSGLLYAPNDHTGLSYRLPRVLQWLEHGRWFWIHTPNYRMNDRACGIEWLSAPLLLFLKSDRVLFLLNFVPFVLMPGLIFSMWTRMGVRPRVAWSWMWLVPTGYCFLIQAGGIANDGFPTVYALAMMDFALRAGGKEQGSGRLRQGYDGLGVEGRGSSDAPFSVLNPFCSGLGLSLLSAALMVGAKASNLPLGLPWAIVFFPALVKVFRFEYATRNTQHVSRFTVHVLAWPFVFLIALLISFIPTAILNIHYVHDWSGLNIEHAGMAMKNPIAGIAGNAVLLVTENFVPTIFPMAGWWNHHGSMFFPSALIRLMDANFEFGYNNLGELPIEDAAGLGFGVSVLLVFSIVAGLKNRKLAESSHRTTLVSRLLLIAPWISLLAYAMKTGMVTPSRLIAPYYPLLFPALLLGAGQALVVRRRWWVASAGFCLLLALVALVLNPSRPLWPANTILAGIVARHPGQPQLLRAQKVYRVYADRPDPLAGIRPSFPPGLTVIGFMGTGDDLDISLWKPYGSRWVEPFFLEDSPEKIRALGIEYAVVGGFNLHDRNTTIEAWLKQSGAELVTTTNATMTVIQGPQPWYLVQLKR